MQSLRHRSADVVPSDITKSSSLSPRLRRKGSSNRGIVLINSRLQHFAVFMMCTVAIVYVIALSFIADNQTAGQKPGVVSTVRKKDVVSPQKVQRQAEDYKAKRKAEQQRDQKEQQEQAPPEHEKHISKPWEEILPKLKSLKERYPPVDKLNSSKKNIFKPFSKKNRVQLDQKRDKKGNVVYTPITKVKKEDLESMGFRKKEINALKGISHDKAIKGRERLVQILNEAGILDIDPEAIALLPKWSSVKKLYGEKPVILGLEHCERFRTQFDPEDASIGTAGMFNTGTNPFAMYISNNCKLPNNKRDRSGGTRWQVPWGKHMPAHRKWTNTAGHDYKTNKTNVMPIVLVRDPFSWMQSMCKHAYEARWPHSKVCPNLANEKLLKNGQPDIVPLMVRYKPPANYTSLAHYWAQWYKEYLEVDYPRLIVRFEDIQFHARELIETVCQCAGAVPRNKDGMFRYVVDSAKWGAAHKSQTNMISAMVKYGSDKNRFAGMREADWLVAKDVFTPEIMDLFGYEMPERLK
eukprot:CAMPEP_0172364342 /NCGR_PEP_ID=MMETSP1060-20121228/7485_1 /TAXON_ID=37318 /ORGANISM="Pseudo-nitzschia pungens, Strain cf. cingulata" /LENGTH=521 /DNA_ID=CAMNT_0013087313 /DNA_START=122 /DNA_END=1687 /DNA_ORIENTATION=-